MSPLMILLLMLILAIGSGHQIALKKYTMGDEPNRSISGTGHRNSSIFERLNYATIGVDKNDVDPSMDRRIRLRQDLQHFLSLTAKRIIEQHGRKGPRVERKGFKSVESNKIPIGEFPEDAIERGAQARRDSGSYKNIIGENSGQVREKVSKDLFQVSEALLPTIRRIAQSRLRKVREYRKEAIKARINRGNGSEELKLRVKRQETKNEANDPAAWLKKDFTDHQTNMKMHAFIVKDEEIPPCCSPAKHVTDRRYFMCSGAVLTLKHAITSASCVHYADVYERNVEADLAVLVGATEPRAYVIKINRYDMHPDYDYDVDSRNHATHNLAILHLACSIVAQDIVVPSLPKGHNDDVAHMCCREGCDFITIMEDADNRHTAHIVPAMHLPAPRHDDDNDNDNDEAPRYRDLPNGALQQLEPMRKPIFSNDSFPVTRRIRRSPFKLAAAPTFFGKDTRRTSRIQTSTKSEESTNTKKRKKTKSGRKSSVKNQQRDRKIKKPLKLDDLINKGRPGRAFLPIMRALEQQGVSVEEQLAAIDWQKVEETLSKKIPVNEREKLDNFARNVADETMRRLQNVLDDDDHDGEGGPLLKANGSTVFEKLMPSMSKNKTIESFVHVFTKVVSSLVPPHADGALALALDTSVEEKDLKDPPPSNQDCPPLGSPVFADGTLIGLLAYTCDDVQTWVEWKYVSITRNINWIRKQMMTEYKPVDVCSGSEKPVQNQQPPPRNKVGEDVAEKNKPLKQEREAEIGEPRKAEWTRRETSVDAQRSASTRNLDHAMRVAPPATGSAYRRIPKDPWLARNSPLTPQRADEPHQPRFFVDSRNQPQSLPQNPTVYNINTCYVKPDGSTDCQTRSGFGIR